MKNTCRTKSKERLGRMVLMHSNKREENLFREKSRDATRHAEFIPRQGKLIKRREIIAMIWQSFKSSDRWDLVFTSEHRTLVLFERSILVCVCV